MLITWEALGFVFAILPGIVGIAYCYTCGRFRKRPKLTGYLDFINITNKAKKDAYLETAKLFQFTVSGTTKGIIFLAWVFSIIVELMGPNFILTIVLLLLALPLSVVVYFIGKGQPQLKDN